MNDARSMQFFLEKEIPEKNILDFLGVAIGFLVESTDIEIQNSAGFAQVSSHPQGFKQGILVTWSSAVELALAPDKIVKLMATRLGVSVLLESATDEDAWLLAKPDGSLESVSVVYLDDGIDVKEAWQGKA